MCCVPAFSGSDTKKQSPNPTRYMRMRSALSPAVFRGARAEPAPVLYFAISITSVRRLEINLRLDRRSHLGGTSALIRSSHAKLPLIINPALAADILFDHITDIAFAIE